MNLDPSTLPRLLHRIIRIIKYVQENLLQLLRIAQRRRQRFFKIFQHFHAVARKIIAPQLNRLPQHAVHLDRFPLHRPLPRKAQQILNDVFRPLRFLQNNLQIIPRR